MRRVAALVLLVAAAAACERQGVEVELRNETPSFSRAEERAIQEVADAAFRDARLALPGLPETIVLEVGRDRHVIPETRESGTTLAPRRVVWMIDLDADALSVITKQLRPTLFHELHHLARAAKVKTDTLMDNVVTEGLATAFERDFAGVNPPWGKAPPEVMDWARELLAQPSAAPVDTWVIRHPDGRRWIGMRVGTFLVDRAAKASGRSAATMVYASTDEIVRLADVPQSKPTGEPR